MPAPTEGAHKGPHSSTSEYLYGGQASSYRSYVTGYKMAFPWSFSNLEGQPIQIVG